MVKTENYSESYREFLRFDHKEERLKKVVLSSCGKDMLLVTEDNRILTMLWFAMADVGVICLERLTYYVESLVKFQVSGLYSSEIVVSNFRN